ncbi:MAG: SH3 domain-containing protein [Lachnospiraceae bacterium]|nr:SH3 domain-containing protein [Lachnospiraceae bacterium]
MEQTFRRFTAVLMILVLLALVPGNGLVHRASAEDFIEETYPTSKTGTIKVTLANTTSLNVRKDAKTASDLVATLPNGTKVQVLGTKKYTSGKLWYKISFTYDGKNMEGYGFAEYIVLTTPKPADEVFATPKKGYTDYSPVTNVRSGAGSNYALVKGKNGESLGLITCTYVTVYERKNNYYRCAFTVDGEQKTGWLYADFVRLYDDPKDDAAFVADLRAQGFPETYIEPLRILHSQHPTWVFKADKTGLDWKTAVDNESAFQRSLVYYSSPTSWKRVDDLAYIWNNNGTDGGFKKLDGPYWVAANRTITAYFMDPRNFLAESELFQFECQSFDENVHTLDRVQGLLEGTFMSGNIPGEYKWKSQKVNRDAKGKITSIDTEEVLSGGTPLTYAEVFLESARISGVSPDMLVARVIQEMGTAGNSLIISGNHKTYPGLYNYYDFDTYADGVTDAITKGLFFASRSADVAKTAANYLSTAKETCRPWNRRWKALYGGAILIGRDYISKGQDTLYYQKFNVSSEHYYSLYSHQYMTNIQAPANESRTMWAACKDKETAMLFKIPVYNNMPAERAAYPASASTANPNPYLKSLAVENFEMTPEFDYKTFEYDLIVDEDTDRITIQAAALATTTKITGAGTITIKPGENTIKIKSTAAYGNYQEYVINVYREVPEDVELTEHIKTSCIFDGDYLYGIDPGTTLETLSKVFSIVEGGTIKLRDPQGGTVTSGPIGTGFSIVTPQEKFTPVILGDVNKDGEISIYDLLFIKRQMLGLVKLDEPAMLAADVKKDGTIDIYDMLFVKRHMLSLALIEQPRGEEKVYGPTTSPTPTPTTKPTDTPTPTPTTEPTGTPTPTPDPSGTPTPTPDPTTTPTTVPDANTGSAQPGTQDATAPLNTIEPVSGAEETADGKLPSPDGEGNAGPPDETGETGTSGGENTDAASSDES